MNPGRLSSALQTEDQIEGRGWAKLRKSLLHERVGALPCCSNVFAAESYRAG